MSGLRFVIVGHSHGSSTKGVTNLAVERSNRVAEYLISKGVSPKNVHRYGSWSTAGDDYAPSRGVRLYAFAESSPDMMIAISLN